MNLDRFYKLEPPRVFSTLLKFQPVQHAVRPAISKYASAMSSQPLESEKSFLGPFQIAFSKALGLESEMNITYASTINEAFRGVTVTPQMLLNLREQMLQIICSAVFNGKEFKTCGSADKNCVYHHYDKVKKALLGVRQVRISACLFCLLSELLYFNGVYLMFQLNVYEWTDLIKAEIEHSPEAVSCEQLLQQIVKNHKIKLEGEARQTFMKAHDKYVKKRLMLSAESILSNNISQRSQNNDEHSANIFQLQLDRTTVETVPEITNNSSNSSSSSSSSSISAVPAPNRAGLAFAAPLTVSTSIATAQIQTVQVQAISHSSATKSTVSIRLDGTDVEAILPQFRILHSFQNATRKVHSDDVGREMDSENSLYIIVHDRFRIVKPGVTSITDLRLLRRFRNALGGISQFGMFKINNGENDLYWS